MEKALSELSIVGTVEELLLDLESRQPSAKLKLNKFVEAFNKKFPSNTKLQDRGRADAITWALMDSPLLLYALNMNGSAIIELHGIVESFALRETVNHLRVSWRIFQHHHLPDLVSVLFDLAIFDKEDVKFAEKLNRIRNGLAHKNPKAISNALCSGKTISVLDTDSVMTKFDIIPLLIGTISILVKMSKAKRRSLK